MTLRTRNIILTAVDLDVEWCFRHYLHLTNILTGANIKIKSPFSIDKEPSFSLYKKEGQPYLWNCLSSGQKGDIIELVRRLKSIELKRELKREEAFRIIKGDFMAFLSGNEMYIESKINQLVNTKGEVTDHIMRRWETKDIDFWSPGGITKKMLEGHNIAPISQFTIHKIKDSVEQNLVIKNPLSYGYYSKGELCKIYQPGIKSAKFIKVKDYIQGSDQLKFKADNLLIQSSMKDGLCFDGLDIPGYEWVAPDSENILIPKYEIEFYKTKFKKIEILFDNDKAGIEAAAKYTIQYGLPSHLLKMEKDNFESVAIWGQPLTRIKLLQEL